MIRRQDLGDGVALLAFAGEGRVNTLGSATNRDFAALIDEVLEDAAVRGIVIGSDRAEFLAGGDLEELRAVRTPQQAIGIVAPFLAALRRMETGGKPVVAALNGTALGGGLELALACHRRIAADNPAARFGLPEVTLGLLPGGGGTQRLPRLIGLAAAAPLLLEGRRLTAAEACAAGVIDEVVPADRLLDAAKAWILSNPKPVQRWDERGFVLPGFAPQSAAGRQFFMAAWARLRRRSAGCDAAAEAILEVLHHGVERRLDAGIAIETRHFARLAASPDAQAKIRTLFVGVTEARAMRFRPDAPVLPLARIAVLGGGVMGRGIAHVAARAGLDVVLLDVSEDRAAAARDAIGQAAAREVERGRSRITAEDVLARITPTASYDRIAGSDLVIEAVFERAELKRAVLARAAGQVGADVPIASNTSTIPIAALASAVPRPARVIGLHFFSPVERMQLVEVIRTAETSDATLACALDLLRRLDKAPVVVRDGLGFFTSRVVTTYSSEAFNLLAEGVPPQVIDGIAVNAGFAIGPLSLADLTTLPLLADIFASMRGDGRRIANAGSQAEQTVATLADAGRHGKAAGGGIYDYGPDGRDPWPGLRDRFPAQAALDDATVRDRLLCVQSLEAARALEEGVLGAPIDGDVASVLGWGYPAHLGGVFAYVDRGGATDFVARCEELARRFGGRFVPPEILREGSKRVLF
jgi:3-hydroxyacyl-CoA dehydrogenase/enoyl-CoA hydratase/3-hydroxybutyryl-CoA epimerase